MARTTKPLTNTEVKQAKPKEKVYTLSDGGGLQLRVKPNGSKLWLFAYLTPYTKKRTSISIGAYPSLSIADARKESDRCKTLLIQNIDPKEYRDDVSRSLEEAHTNTLEHTAKKWLEVKESNISPDHAKDIWRSLELHIFPSLGKLPIHKITAVRAIDCIRPIAAKGSLDTVKRLCQRLNEVMIYAVNAGITNDNPLSGIGKAFKSPAKKNLPALSPDELPMLMKKLSIANIKLVTRSLIEWQLHTMVRPSEAAGTQWSEINITSGLWQIPAERMKSKKPHTVPLSPQCLELLDLLKPITGRSTYVFPSDRNIHKHSNPQTANMALKRMGFENKLVAHGLRSIASTTLNEQGFDPDIIEAALAHIGKNEVRNAYNRADYIERRKPMMKWWSDHIDQAATGNLSLSGSRGLKIVNG